MRSIAKSNKNTMILAILVWKKQIDVAFNFVIETSEKIPNQKSLRNILFILQPRMKKLVSYLWTPSLTVLSLPPKIFSLYKRKNHNTLKSTNNLKKSIWKKQMFNKWCLKILVKKKLIVINKSALKK